MQPPHSVLQRQLRDLTRLSGKIAEAVGEDASEDDYLPRLSEDFADLPERSQVLLSRNGVGKTTLLNNLTMLGQADQHGVRAMAPQRYVKTPDGRSQCAVSEAVAKVISEEETLGDGPDIKYVRNPQADADTCDLKLREQELTFDPIKNLVFRQPEAHINSNSYLLRTGSPDSTTTNSITKMRHGHIPGAIEHFKPLTLLQSEAFAYVQLCREPDADRKPEEERRLLEQYCAITGQAADSLVLPLTCEEVPVCEAVRKVAGITQVYSGHEESLTSFRCFLRANLTANLPLSAIHVALASTTVYWPSTSLEVPFVDTPGTGDANVLNEATTEAAMDDAILYGSQILLCGTKSFGAEASVEQLIIRYMQNMITSTEEALCIRGVLLPETTGWFTHRTLFSQMDQDNRKARVKASQGQLQTWFSVANQRLPEHQRATPDGLEVLQKRCEVRVVYMNLYASLCHQTVEDLKCLADDITSEGRAVTVEELLEATGGPWLLGLSTQLAAQAVLPLMESLSDTHMNQLVTSLHSRLTIKDTMLSAEAKAALVQQCRLMKSSEHLSLRRDTMVQLTISKMAELKRTACAVFVKLGEACKGDCLAQKANIQQMWEERLESTSVSAMSRSLTRPVRGSSVYKTAAYRTTFCHTGIVVSMSDTLEQVTKEAEECLSAFAEGHVLQQIVTNIVEGLQVKLPQADHAALKCLVQQVAESHVKPSLDSLVNRFVKRLLQPARLRVPLREVQEACISAHLLKGDLPVGDAARDALLNRVTKTLTAAQGKMPKAFEAHVHTEVLAFISFLTTTGRRYRGGIERFTETLLKTVMAHVSRDGQSVDTNGQEHLLYKEALQMQETFQQEIAVVKHQATNPLSGDVGMAASLHRVARLSRELQQHPDLLALYDTPTQDATTRITVPQSQWVNLEQSWDDILGQDVRGSLSGNWENRLLSRDLSLPPLTDEEWDCFAQDSLTAALQLQIWPDVGAAQFERLWQAIRAVIAYTMIDIWGEPKVQDWVSKGSSQATAELEGYIHRILSPGQDLGLLELLAFMTSHFKDEVGAPGFTVQVWLPGHPTPIVLSNPSVPDASQGDGAEKVRRSSRSTAYNLLLVTLPKSEKLVWLPLDKTGYTNLTTVWIQRFAVLDDQTVANSVAAMSDTTAGSSDATQAAAQPSSLGPRLGQPRPQAHTGGTRAGTKSKRSVSSKGQAADHSSKKRR